MTNEENLSQIVSDLVNVQTLELLNARFVQKFTDSFHFANSEGLCNSSLVLKASFMLFGAPT